MLRSAVRTLQRYGAVGHDRADVDNRTAAVPQVRNRCAASVNDAPEVHVEQAPLVVEWDICRLAVDGNPRVIDPGVETAELLDRAVPDFLYRGGIGHIRHH